MGQSIYKNPRKVFSQAGGDASLTSRVTTLENNEYKILYFEAISTATGAITKPTGSTILLDQFYSGGDAIVETLSNGQPTGQSPLTVGGSVVSVSSFDLSGNYTLSGTPSSFDVALVYVIKIKAIDYVNLNIDNIMTMDDNLWIEEQLAEKANLTDLPSTLNIYPTNVASPIGGYFKMVSSIDDPDYNDTAVNISTGAITTTNQLIASLATNAGVLIGNPGVVNITTIGNIRKVSGTANAHFYFELYHRTNGGTETLLATSAVTPNISSATYEEFMAIALLNNGTWLATDIIVIKYYGSKDTGGSNPTYEFQFGGSQPVRTTLPVPIGAIGGYELTSNKQNSLVTDGTGTKYPTVDAVNSGLATKGTSYTHVSSAGANLADSTIYIFGQETIGSTTSGNLFATKIRSKGISKTGIIKKVVVSLFVSNSTTTSAETSNIYLRNHTTNTNYLLGTILFRDTLTSAFSQVLTGLNIPVTIGDSCTTMIQTPVFATNPTSTYIHVDYIIE